MQYTNDSFLMPLLRFLVFANRKHHYNISGILNSLQIGYDKRVRPNYGGKFHFFLSFFKCTVRKKRIVTNCLKRKGNKKERERFFLCHYTNANIDRS